MKKLLLLLLIVPMISFGQNGFNYQGIISNSDGTVVASQTIGVQLSILYNSSSGTVAYSELHNPTTDANGLINLRIGTGTQLSLGAFSSVDWSTSYIYLKSEIDITGSGTYVDVGTDLIGQVPVALYAKNVNLLDANNTIAIGGVVSATNSVAIGKDALAANTSGADNTAVGYESLSSNTTGDGNTANGTMALYDNTTGDYNSANGSWALFSNTTGDKNTANGVNSLYSNTTGNNNTAIGHYANVGSNNLTNATAIGYDATVSASNKIQLGNSAVTLVETSGTVSATDLVVNGSYFSTLTSSVSSLESAYANSVSTEDLIATNVALSSIQQDVDGLLLVINASDNRYNTSVGSTTNYFLDDYSSYNTALGYGALTVSTADENTAIGAFALQANTSGDSNTGLGVGALYTNTTGDSNVALGTGALFSNDSGNFNNAMGYDALRNTSTGDNNVALGYQTGDTITTGSNNTLIGYEADVASNAITNATAIGANAVVDASNKIRLGDNSITVIEGKVGFTISSDRRLKANIENTKYGLETILKLAPVDYTLKSNGLAQIGFIAQDLKPIVPEAVNGTEGDIEKGETLGITYTTLIPILTKAIQELKKENEDLKKRIDALENK